MGTVIFCGIIFMDKALGLHDILPSACILVIIAGVSFVLSWVGEGDIPDCFRSQRKSGATVSQGSWCDGSEHSKQTDWIVECFVLGTSPCNEE